MPWGLEGREERREGIVDFWSVRVEALIRGNVRSRAENDMRDLTLMGFETVKEPTVIVSTRRRNLGVSVRPL